MPSEKLDHLPEIPLSVQKQIEADWGNAIREQWRAVDDLKELSVKSAVDRNRIRTKYKTFVKSQL